ncbi:MAG: hypothetical protein A3H96_02810 [Acidobacteria bacterium RIFCSPLOWO2_02_FULL_67_36]|nr:MAG: hypothetical protein A3H96_02810 [Acidobacteria bacterium RIFCSPLOWO2_02_FULL_67_36]
MSVKVRSGTTGSAGAGVVGGGLSFARCAMAESHVAFMYFGTFACPTICFVFGRNTPLPPV